MFERVSRKSFFLYGFEAISTLDRLSPTRVFRFELNRVKSEIVEEQTGFSDRDIS